VSALCPNAFWRERAGNASAAEADGFPSPIEPSPRAPSGEIVVSPEVTLDAAPVLDGMFVEMRQVVRHPNLDGGIAYVEGVDLIRLLSVLPARFAYGDIPELWRGHVPSASSRRIAAWLWNRRVLKQAI
jgi:hypothetical protein